VVDEFFWSADVAKYKPPFDFIIGTDIVYEPVAHKPLLDALLALSTPTTVRDVYRITSFIVYRNSTK
jgi:hypothetical protein